MFEVRGIPIVVDEIEILQTLKQQVLEQTGKHILNKIKRSGNNIMISCPVHNDGQEKHPSCGITTERVKEFAPGQVHCFACGYVASLDQMIADCFGKTDKNFGIKWLINNFLQGEEYERPDIPLDLTRNVEKQKVEYVSEEELKQYRFYHPYMWYRKLTPEIVEKYDIGFQKDYLVYKDENTGVCKYDDVLTFPVRDKDGNCLFISRRSVNEKNFYLPTDMEKVVYGVYELPKDCKTAIICESVFNALTCVAYGVPALALFGTGNKLQYEVLNKLPIRHYILGLDPDKAGISGTYKLKRALKNKLVTKLVIPYGKDINDLDCKDFLSLPEVYM